MMDQGLPPLVSVMDAVNAPSYGAELVADLPLELRQNLAIHECSYRAIRTMFDDRSPSVLPPAETFYARMDTLESSFDLLQLSLGESLSFNVSLHLAALRLYFRCLHFVVEAAAETDQRREGILRAYASAASFITLTISHESAHEELLYAPSAASRMIFAAALVIFRVVHSSYATALPTGLDRNMGQVLYNSASFAIHRCSVQYGEKDLPRRTVDLMKLLCMAPQELH